MGTFQKHLTIVKEKMASVIEAHENGRNSVVGDLATKVVDRLNEKIS